VPNWPNLIIGWVGCLHHGLLLGPAPNCLDYNTCYCATVKIQNFISVHGLDRAVLCSFLEYLFLGFMVGIFGTRFLMIWCILIKDFNWYHLIKEFFSFWINKARQVFNSLIKPHLFKKKTYSLIGLQKSSQHCWS